MLTLIEKNCASDQFKDDADCKATKDKQDIVAVSKLPTANISIQRNAARDLFDWIGYGFGILLAMVGTWGVVVARRGVIATERAAEAALESAKAANAQIKMMKDKERARIQIKPANLDTVDADEPNNIALDFLNIGPTNAYGVTVDAGGRIVVTGLDPEEGEYTDLAVSSLLKPDIPDSSWVVCRFPKNWEDEVLYAKAKIRIEVRGQIRYEDVFGDSHTEEFFFRMNVYGLSQMPNRKVKLKLMRNWHTLPPHEWSS